MKMLLENTHLWSSWGYYILPKVCQLDAKGLIYHVFWYWNLGDLQDNLVLWVMTGELNWILRAWVLVRFLYNLSQKEFRFYF